VIAAALACALAAACCYAVAATLQHAAAAREPVSHTLDPRLLLRLLHRRVWMFGVAADAVGTGLHGAALAFGPLALVQPLLVSGLVIAVPLEAARERRRIRRRDLVGAVVAAAGLATFVVVADPRPGPIAPADADLSGVVAGGGAVLVVLVLLATVGPARRAGWRATVLGIATGAGFALAATLAKACIDVVSTAGLPALFRDWRLAALIVVGLCAVVLNQNAYQRGGLAGPLSGIVLTDPLGSVTLAVLAFDEQIRTGTPALVVELLALLLMGVGVTVVSRSGAACPRGPAHGQARGRPPRRRLADAASDQA
jgi:hypothetical protein